MCGDWAVRKSVWCLVFSLLQLSFLSCSLPEEGVRIKRDVLDDNVLSYLMKYGYMASDAADGAFALRREEPVRDAIRDLQEFAGLPVTGRLDERTRKLLATPRCGLPDRDVRQTSGRRKRYSIHGQKWPYTDLSWSLNRRNLGNLHPDQVRRVISKALEVWARHSKLTFKERSDDKADIQIHFHRLDHGDNFPFDGKGVVLAHAFFPNGGRSIDVHFDADEYWITSGTSDQGTNLFNVAAHEIGHSLGLSHSDQEGALMYPWYKELENGFDYELPEDDKHAIQFLYGAKQTRQYEPINHNYYPRPYPTPPTTTTTTTTTTRPPIRTHPRPRPGYDPHYPHGRHTPHPTRYPNKYPHKQPMHPDKKPHNNPKHNVPMKPERKYPHHRNYPATNTPHRWHPMHTSTSTTTVRYPIQHPHYPVKESPNRKPPPNTCDTSYDAVAVIRREVFIFKDAYFWRINDDGLMPNYPAEIVPFWQGLPDNLTYVDAVYERPDQNRTIVFFIGPQYYVLNANKVEPGYPKPLTDLGLPSTLKKVDGAMVWGHNGKTYFYSGDMYWRFDEDVQKVELDYPRHMGMWKGVGRDIDAVFQWKDGRTYFFKDRIFWKFNDYYMRIEHGYPKPSAPFWMGCTVNIKQNDLGQKLPYRGEEVSSANQWPCNANMSIFFVILLAILQRI